jgi:hypothetical protein
MRRYFGNVGNTFTHPAQWVRTKDIAQIQREVAGTSGREGLKRVLGIHDLLAYGVGSTVGAGVYTVIAVAGVLRFE